MSKVAKSRLREARIGLLFLSPWLIGLAVFTAYPIIASLYFSFTHYSGLSSPRWAGLDNYVQLFKDPLFWKSIYNTLYLAIIGIPLAQVLSILVALLLNTKVKFLGIFRTLYFLPSIVPAVATALLWKWFLNPQFGPVNLLLEKIGLPTPGWLTDPAWSKPALILTSVWGVGGAMVIYLAGLQNIPTELYEAADEAGMRSRMVGLKSWARREVVVVPVAADALRQVDPRALDAALAKLPKDSAEPASP